MNKRSYIFIVSHRVPVEFAPLMAAFMSFFIRTSNVDSKSKSARVKCVEPMIFRLLKFLYKPDFITEKKWRKRKSTTDRRKMIIEKITTKDGNIMTPMEQLEFFADLAGQQGFDIMCHLVKSKNGKLLSTAKPGEIFINIPVIQYPEEKYAATSLNYVFGCNFKPSLIKKKVNQEIKD